MWTSGAATAVVIAVGLGSGCYRSHEAAPIHVGPLKCSGIVGDARVAMSPDEARPVRELMEELLTDADPGRPEDPGLKLSPWMGLSFYDQKSGREDPVYSMAFYPERHVVVIKGYQDIHLSRKMMNRVEQLMNDIKAKYTQSAPQ
jgi:hypothetical protein